MKSLTLAFLLLSLPATIAQAQTKIVYLSCEVSSPEGKPSRHFDFTLNEFSGTVSYYVREANSVNIEQAVFGPTSVVWSTKSDYIQTARIIDRTTLSFTELVAVLANVRKETGTCQIVSPPERKF